jgi:hypothetical protein
LTKGLSPYRLGKRLRRELLMVLIILAVMMGILMSMAMRMGADSPSPILAAIRIEKER